MWKITFQTKQTFLDIFSPAIEPFCDTVSWVEIEDPTCDWDSEDWIIEGHAAEKPNPADVEVALMIAARHAGLDVRCEDLHIEPLQETNWLEAMWETFPPQTVGPFFIHSSFYDKGTPAHLIPLILNAATAFGSGEHGTTSGCLMAIAELKEQGFTWSRGCDLGCGSGILAIGACKLAPTPFEAIDLDPEAVRVTNENIHINDVDAWIHASEGDCIPKDAGFFDVIFANILAAPLINLAPNVAQHLSLSGYVILSGLLDWQQKDVEDAYKEQGLTHITTYNRERWITLVFQKQ